MANAQTVVQHWRMGEDDPGAVAGNNVNATLMASVGSNLNLSGSGLSYTTDTAPDLGGLAVAFSGAGNYAVGSNLGLSTNFAIETWVNFSSLASTQWVFVLGNGGNLGGGVLFNSANSRMGGVKSGVNFFAYSDVLTADTWYHVAFVMDDTGNASFYFNGSLVSGTDNIGFFADNFSLGGDENGNARLQGKLDDVRVFTFASGTFDASMLSYVAPIPEASTYTLLAGCLALGAVVWRRHRRR